MTELYSRHLSRGYFAEFVRDFVEREYLPDGVLPAYDELVPIAWPEWAVEGAIVYHREEDYKPYVVTVVTDRTLRLSEAEPLKGTPCRHILYSDLADFDVWSETVPPTIWERIG